MAPNGYPRSVFLPPARERIGTHSSCGVGYRSATTTAHYISASTGNQGYNYKAIPCHHARCVSRFKTKEREQKKNTSLTEPQASRRSRHSMISAMQWEVPVFRRRSGISYSISDTRACEGVNSHSYCSCGVNYWSATTNANNTNNAYYIRVSDGNQNNNNKTNTNNLARCVRRSTNTASRFFSYSPRNKTASNATQALRRLRHSTTPAMASNGYPRSVFLPPARERIENHSSCGVGFWSATTTADNVYTIAINDGHQDLTEKTFTGDRARCVRRSGKDGAPHYSISTNICPFNPGAAAVTTSLTEPQALRRSRHSTISAMQWGISGFSVKKSDLSYSIFDTRACEGANSHSYCSGGNYWSATSNNTNNAYYINVSTGNQNNNNKTNTGNRARCVRRSGKAAALNLSIPNLLWNSAN